MDNKAPLTLAIIFMIIGVVTGYNKQNEIFSGGPEIPILSQISGLHASLIVIGFLTILIMHERLTNLGLMPIQKGEYILRNALILTILGYLIYIYAKTTYIRELSWIATGILFLGGILFIRYMDIISVRLDKNNYYLSLISIAAYLGFIYYMATGTKNYTAYSLLILSYPLLFIISERIEITRFIPQGRRKMINLIPLLGGISILILLIWNNVAFTQGTAPASILLLILLAVMFKLEYTNIQRLLKIGRWMMKYQALHISTAYITALLGLLTYIIFTHILTKLPVLDTAIHLIALGFIGNMLLAHGPAILTIINGRSLDEDKIRLYPYIILNGALLTRIVANAAKILKTNFATQLYEASGLLVILLIPAFFLMVRDAAK